MRSTWMGPPKELQWHTFGCIQNRFHGRHWCTRERIFNICRECTKRLGTEESAGRYPLRKQQDMHTVLFFHAFASPDQHQKGDPKKLWLEINYFQKWFFSGKRRINIGISMKEYFCSVNNMPHFQWLNIYQGINVFKELWIFVQF